MLLKANTKRRRSKAEILAAKEEEVAKLREEVKKDLEIARLREQLERKSQEVEKAKESQDFVNEMLRSGQAKVNEKGQFQLMQ